MLPRLRSLVGPSSVALSLLAASVAGCSGGGEGEPQGGNNHDTAGEQAQGPGFTEEGSYELDEQGEGIRMHEQKLGEDAPGKSVQRPQDDKLD